ncbi:LysR family transcriptional regulator [Oceanobacillus senegalensis]|uniref:LysR family transcriptional regulator n=1 Tax=Oceanobacillus senegalensis TaxID=1936063 RepID=UPI000A30A72D|nr:LysR family transcriptional regulator [Oceanobacillus senegalensis]
MKIEDYALLLKLHEIGTIRGTAKIILISQPAVTQRLKYMEEYFGEQIFIRTTKQLIPTPSGEIILDYARRIVEQEKELKNLLAKSSTEIQGTLSIACSSLISQRFLPAILGEYTASYPKVTIDLVTGISEDIQRDYKNYHVSIIRGEPLKDGNCIRLFADPLYIFDTEKFPKNKLKERPLISFKSDDSMNEQVENWLFHHQDKIKALKMMTVDQIETCKQFMKQGIGMAVLPESVSDRMKDEYPNVPLKLNGKVVTRDTWLCYQEGVQNLPQVAQFISLLTNTTFL